MNKMQKALRLGLCGILAGLALGLLSGCDQQQAAYYAQQMGLSGGTAVYGSEYSLYGDGTWCTNPACTDPYCTNPDHHTEDHHYDHHEDHHF